MHQNWRMTQLPKVKRHTHGEVTERRGEAEGATLSNRQKLRPGGLIQEEEWLEMRPFLGRLDWEQPLSPVN